jgi:hypothetical protein
VASHRNGMERRCSGDVFICLPLHARPVSRRCDISHRTVMTVI